MFQLMRERNSGVGLHETVRKAEVQLSSLSTYSPESNWRGFRGNNTHEGNEATREKEYGSTVRGGKLDEEPNPQMVSLPPTPPLPSEEPKAIEEFMRERELVGDHDFFSS